ncbi:MAG TPA: bifunctional glycosyltransferase family 2 protein/CDP-glycerol:glycerophosphate glycerophosphotransferase [Mobilitalea sp.]|nr:bifunctional glycosyltransferase family 2 protein/CDP-glycerol:glycerophosphate glycerophosphotransferase [Mobilitalea sp.]
MRISVIIPFHKGLFFLEEALQSLLEQTYRDFEVLLICDHIEEDIGPMLKTYEGMLDIKELPLVEGTGVAAARNYGLQVAQGDYIYFLDSDDYIALDTLELMAIAAERENCDLVYGKKSWTWFKRSTFLANQNRDMEKGEEAEGDEDEEESTVSSGQLDMENGGESESESTLDDNQLLSEATDIDKSEEDGGGIDRRIQAHWNLISARKSIRNITVLHILIRRSLIEENNLRFKDDIIYLSDCPFVFQLLQSADSFSYEPEAFYMKRNHNDSINNPSLSQEKGAKSFSEYISTYLYTVGLIPTDSDLRRRLDKKILRYYAIYFAPRMRRTKKIKQRERQFEVLHQLACEIDKNLLRQQVRYRRRLFKALVEGNLTKSLSLVNRHLAYKKLKRITRNRRALAKFLYIHRFLKKSVKDNWVFCESFFGKNYSDSPKYIYEYLSANYPGEFKFIWVIDKKKTHIPYRHVKVKRFSIRYCYYLARCKYYVFNGRQPEWARKRKGNVFLQTWHGTPLKRLVFDQEDISSATSRYKKQTYRQSRAWDYLIAPNGYSSEIFRRCFLYNKVMLETGYPRNDILHDKNREQVAAKIKDKLGIPRDKKTILYAPTWRDDEYYSKGRYKFALQLDLRKLKEKLGKDYVILLRTHYFIADSLDTSGLEDFAFNLSKYDDIAELYLISDILITDYSSVFFDYANLRRPMLFFMYDLEKYRDVLRGFYINIEEELPGPLLFTSDEVIEAINNIDTVTKDYEDKYKLFYDKFCAWEDGNASQKVAEAVFNLNGN